MIITIADIPHDQQRYETVGDWQWNDKGNLLITISNMNDWKYNFLVAFHEQIEVMLCKAKGISQESVDNFDMEYEARRSPEDTTSEPGDSELAPYHNEHVFATKLEQEMAKDLGVNWEEYEKAIYSL
jgi:hypothetical protein